MFEKRKQNLINIFNFNQILKSFEYYKFNN